MELSDYPKHLLSIEKLASKIYGGLSFSGKIFIERQDLVQAGKIGLWQAIKKKNNDGLKSFDAYAYLRVKGEMIDTIRKFCLIPKGMIRKKEFYFFIEMDEQYEETTHINTDHIDVDRFIKNIKNERTKRIMNKYLRGFFLLEIAQDESLSESRVSQIIKKAIKDIQVEYAI